MHCSLRGKVGFKQRPRFVRTVSRPFWNAEENRKMNEENSPRDQGQASAPIETESGAESTPPLVPPFSDNKKQQRNRWGHLIPKSYIKAKHFAVNIIQSSAAGKSYNNHEGVLALFVAVAVAEEMMAAESYPVATYHQGPALAASSAGHAYGAHGAHSRGYGAHGQSHYGDHGRYADRAHAAHGHHNIGGAASHDAYGAHASNYGKYRNVGAYAQDKGAGYEKAYAYDKKAGHHAITADHGARAGHYGVHDRRAHHNVGAYARAGHDRHGAHDRYGAQAHGVRAHDSGAYGRYGAAHAQMVHHAPAVHTTYHHAPAPVSHGYSRY
ncbi:hypothetical protein TNCV_4473311 [Trichonephila clavipes]|uniref:Uncharacterized protein n=1 Tax=Trichonephila clavipes TaxID=2585209 RepID=A0A8X6VKQ9_TRICX|nr:hypothetical protein TNCV_4473311 [Trichonephila clavipes]